MFRDTQIYFYVGNRCELEIIGFYSYPWWAVYQYHSTPFKVIGGVVAVLIVIFCCWLLIKRYISKIRIDKIRLATDCDRERKVRMKLEKDQKRLEEKQKNMRIELKIFQQEVKSVKKNEKEWRRC